MSCDGQNAGCRIILSAVVQTQFKFRSFAGHCGH